MKILIELPFDHYYRLLARCEMSSREHAIMKNSVIERSGDSAVVKIVCYQDEARRLLALANRAYAGAVPDIEKWLALGREP